MAIGYKILNSVMFCLISATLVFGYHDLGYQYLYPKPDAPRVPCEAGLIIRLNNVTPDKITNLETFIKVQGQNGQIYTGTCKIASDKRTILFRPDRHFLTGEQITVSLTPETRESIVKPITYHFTVSLSKSLPPVDERPAANTTAVYSEKHRDYLQKQNTRQSTTASQSMIMPNGVSVPSNFPHINITVNDNPDDEYIFIDNRGGNGVPWNVIFDNSGSPVWYWQVPDERRDFKVQANGWATMIIRWGYEEFGGSGQGFLALDNHYKPVKTYYATNGYYTDEHELQVLEDGGYLIIGRREDGNVDMSKYVNGGQKNATVRETCVQEYTADDELILQWAAWDHLDITAIQLSDPTSSTMYFSHMNSIDVDDDGNLIVSNRELSEVTKINRQTGDVIWRLGGAHNQFTYINDPLLGTRNQHSARVLGNNVYSMFDNGNLHNPSLSRAVKYKLDTNLMTATLIWEFRDKPDKYSHYMGNAQPLPNGNMLINWAVGDLPKLTEVRPNGTKAFEMNWVDQYEAYRVHRCTWNGKSEVPNLIVESYPDNLTLIFNKFGDPDVDYYRIYAGNSSHPTTVYDTSSVTLKKITTLENGNYWFRVTAVSKTGQESGYSNEEAVQVNFSDPGGNLVNNGDFSQGTQDWIWELQDTGQAELSVKDGEARISILNGGSNDYDVQLRQNGIPLTNGAEYTFEFDARADATRIIEAKVGQDQSPFNNYSKSTYYSLKRTTTHYTWDFTMEDPTDLNARVVFNMGNSNTGVYLDNISVKKKTLQWSYNGTANAIPGTIECEEYDFGGEGLAFHDDTVKDGITSYRPQDNVDVEETSDTGGGYNVGWAVSGEWLEYTVDVEPGLYTIGFRTASEPGGGIMRVLLDDRFLAEFDIAATGGWQSWTTLQHPRIQIPGGQNQILRLEIVQGDFNLNWIKFIRMGSDVDKKTTLPRQYRLNQNYPNPFNPETQIDYQLPEKSHVSIEVIDIRGRHVTTLLAQQQQPGEYHVIWDGNDENGLKQA
ncbi:aryl-sulfate sulfotransferase, partial [candidate division KSB1 bacterium]|nr:aryl-sulfate sulfotransferase [candidate division KSB1 bacterium]